MALTGWRGRPSTHPLRRRTPAPGLDREDSPGPLSCSVGTSPCAVVQHGRTDGGKARGRGVLRVAYQRGWVLRRPYAVTGVPGASRTGPPGDRARCKALPPPASRWPCPPMPTTNSPPPPAKPSCRRVDHPCPGLPAGEPERVHLTRPHLQSNEVRKPVSLYTWHCPLNAHKRRCVPQVMTGMRCPLQVGAGGEPWSGVRLDGVDRTAAADYDRGSTWAWSPGVRVASGGANARRSPRCWPGLGALRTSDSDRRRGR